MAAKKIAFYIARYSVSGVPLAQMRLAEAFQARGYCVEFVIAYCPSDVTIAEKQSFRTIVFNYPRAILSVAAVARHIRTYKPDIIFSAEDHMNMVVTLATVVVGSRAKLSLSSRVTPYDTYSIKRSWKNGVLRFVMPLVWRRANAVTCVSEGMVEQYREIFGGAIKQRAVYNIIASALNSHRRDEPVDHRWLKGEFPVFVASGRLAPEKGYEDLLRAMAIVIEREPSAKLIILGDGPLKQMLERLRQQLGLQDVVDFPGFVTNPMKYYKNSSAFVLSSYVEGMPNVLIEALFCELPLVAYNCKTGPEEILTKGGLGFLVEVGHVESLAKKMIESLTYQIDKTKAQQTLKKFSEGAVIDRHLKLLDIG